MDQLSGLILTIIIVIIVFLVLREFWTWYWKINSLVKNQQETNVLLKQILNVLKDNGSFDNIEGEVIIKVVSTGEIKSITRAEWDNLMATNPDQTKYRLVKIRE
jgi:K+ transporter